MVEVFGSHGGYILASYCVGILILGGMIGSAWLQLHKAKTRLAQLESKKADKHP